MLKHTKPTILHLQRSINSHFLFFNMVDFTLNSQLLCTLDLLHLIQVLNRVTLATQMNNHHQKPNKNSQ